MLVGSVGTGKTSLVQGFLRDNASDTLLSCTINTSYYTDAAAMQRQLEQPLDKVCSFAQGSKAFKNGCTKNEAAPCHLSIFCSTLYTTHT